MRRVQVCNTHKQILFDDFKKLERLIKPQSIRNIYHFKPFLGFSIDSRSLKEGEGFIAVEGLHKDGHDFINQAVSKGAVFVIGEKYVDNALRIPFFVVDDSQRALAAIVKYIRKRKSPLVYGITGSVGKTTVKEILGFLLAPYYKVLKNRGTENNFLGLSKTILSLDDEQVVILEMGTSQKGEIETLTRISDPDIGVITSVKPVHLEGLGCLNGVFKEKSAIFKVNPRIKAVLNINDYYLKQLKNQHSVCWFGSKRKADLFFRFTKRSQGKSVFLFQDKYRFSLPCYLESMIVNFSAAILSARLLGIPLFELINRAQAFNGFLPMRMELKRKNGFLILNDAYNANPYSLQQAFSMLKQYSSQKIIVLADMLELGKKTRYYHERIASDIVKNKFDYCLTFGVHTFYLHERLKSMGYKKTFHFSDHKTIARFITQKIITSKRLRKRYLIFLKGSRKMKLENIISYLK